MTGPRGPGADGVSRETNDRLKIHIDLLIRWNARINLVSPSTLDTVWRRHVADSLQLFPLAPDHARSWIDIGSGAGFPALPVAAVAAELNPLLRVTLVESDARKCAFLSEAARAMGVEVTILRQRAESLPPKPHDVVSARAVAPLARLCSLAHRFCGPGTVLLFPKGTKADSELTAARAHWHIQAERIASRTDPMASVLRILELDPRS